MALEDLTGGSKYISHLVNTNPDGAADSISDGDAHLRGIKNVLLNTFPNVTGAVTKTHTALNNSLVATDTATISGVWTFTGQPVYSTGGNSYKLGPTYGGWIGTGATLSELPAGWSVASVSTGVYRITHNLGLTIAGDEIACTATVLATGTTPYVAVVKGTTANTIDLAIYNLSGTAVDQPVLFTVALW